jgi:hypothetical protein
MFRPNRICQFRPKMNQYDEYGMAMFAPTVSVPFALVRFDTKVDDTTVRADSSATRGNVKEYSASGRILVVKTFKPAWGDMVTFDGKVFKVKEVEPRYNVLGLLDHYECDLEKSEDIFGDEL